MLKNFLIFGILYFFLLFTSKGQGVIESIKNSNLFEKKQSSACKADGYKRKKISGAKSRKKSKAVPYQYVYKSATSGTISKSDFNSSPPAAKTPVAKTQSKNQQTVYASNAPTSPAEKSMPVVSANSNSKSNLKNMNSNDRKKAVLDMPPSRSLEPIRFLSDQDEFSVVNMDSFMEALELINEGKMILVEGHTDDLGSEDYNLKLSMKRVEKIRQLMLQAGANDNLIAVMGYGESKPIVPNTDDKSREINRRIEFKVFDL